MSKSDAEYEAAFWRMVEAVEATVAAWNRSVSEAERRLAELDARTDILSPEGREFMRQHSGSTVNDQRSTRRAKGTKGLRVIIETTSGERLFVYERGENCLFPAEEESAACASILREAGAMFGGNISPLKLVAKRERE